MRILLVDNSEQIRQRLRSFLGGIAGIRVVDEAATVGQALALLRSRGTDLMILDLRMPDGGGFAVLEKLQQMSSPPPTVVFSNYPHQAYRERCNKLGALCLLDKSKQLAQLGELVEAMARGLSVTIDD